MEELISKNQAWTQVIVCSLKEYVIKTAGIFFPESKNKFEKKNEIDNENE